MRSFFCSARTYDDRLWSLALEIGLWDRDGLSVKVWFRKETRVCICTPTRLYRRTREI